MHQDHQFAFGQNTSSDREKVKINYSIVIKISLFAVPNLYKISIVVYG